MWNLKKKKKVRLTGAEGRTVAAGNGRGWGVSKRVVVRKA